jgi:ABC-2 type transport system permease protein
VLVVAGLVLFHAKTHGSWLLATLVILVGTAAFVSVGFLLCAAARTSEAARGLAAMVAFPMMFLSGVFIPLDALPQVMQNIVHALPLTYLTEALHGILNDGDGLTRTVAIDIGVLAAWAVVCFSVAAARFRWE